MHHLTILEQSGESYRAKLQSKATEQSCDEEEAEGGCETMSPKAHFLIVVRPQFNFDAKHFAYGWNAVREADKFG